MSSIRALIVIGTAALLAACGGSDSLIGSGSTGGGATDTTTSSGIRIGSGTGDGFSAGILAIGTSSQLSAGGSTSVTATLVDGNGAPYDAVTAITFTSTCAADSLATLTSPVNTSNGAAVSTYQAIGCSGTDTITAFATVDGEALSASGTVSVAPASLGSIQFVSAEPTTMALKGTGGAGLQETSVVTFKVLNSSGGPVPNTSVTFSLSTTVGGLSLSPATGTTGADGKVQTIVQAGSVAVPVRVLAKISDSPSISTQSDKLTVSTGIPVDTRVDISAETLNPEAYNYDGVTVQVNANVADRFSNPVPDGTVVNFRTEAGRVQGSCTTTDGACSVTWTSQSQGLADGDAAGVSTILAYAVGEESFGDENGNGRFDDGDTFTSDRDIGEAFVDYNYDNVRDSGEPYIDFNENGTFEATGDGAFNGVLCEHSSLCGATTSVIVSDKIRLVLSTSAAAISFSTGSLNVRGGSGSVIVTVEDLNTNIMPAGTTIAVSAPSGVELSGTSSFTVPNAASLVGTTFGVVLNDGDTDPAATGTGFLEIKVTSPRGLITTDSIQVTY
jgi:hypothetical protein